MYPGCLRGLGNRGSWNRGRESFSYASASIVVLRVEFVSCQKNRTYDQWPIACRRARTEWFLSMR